MIISHQHRFVFLHNPKAGGTSIRIALERFNDIGFGLWSTEPDQTGGVAVDRAHLGLDEFGQFYPDLWDRVRGYRMFCLYRDPYARFLSSVSEYSKRHGDADLRFTGPEQGRALLFRLMEQLEPLERADAPGLMSDLSLTHFRPQWIYWSSALPEIRVTAFPTREMDRLMAEISGLVGAPVTPRHEKAAESYDLPAPLKLLARARGLRQLARRLPGIGRLKDSTRQRYATGRGRNLTLDAADQARVDAFVRRFYATDYARWPA